VKSARNRAAEELRWLTAAVDKVDPGEVILENDGNELSNETVVLKLQTKNVKAFLCQNFQFESPRGKLTIPLRRTATLQDALEILGQHFETKTNLIHFQANGKSVLDLTTPLASLGSLSISINTPINFFFQGRQDSLTMDCSIKASAMKKAYFQDSEKRNSAHITLSAFREFRG
jgi:hypothetical protein